MLKIPETGTTNEEEGWGGGAEGPGLKTRVLKAWPSSHLPGQWGTHLGATARPDHLFLLVDQLDANPRNIAINGDNSDTINSSIGRPNEVTQVIQPRRWIQSFDISAAYIVM